MAKEALWILKIFSVIICFCQAKQFQLKAIYSKTSKLLSFLFHPTYMVFEVTEAAQVQVLIT